MGRPVALPKRHYTSPTVIQSIYEAVGRMGIQPETVLEPAMG